MTTSLRKNVSGAAMGVSIPRVEGHAKVTGRAEYVHNLQLPGMLYGKVCRSTVAHARIRGIDVDAARALPGVYAVYTAEDIRRLIPEPYYGPAFHDRGRRLQNPVSDRRELREAAGLRESPPRKPARRRKELIP